MSKARNNKKFIVCFLCMISIVIAAVFALKPLFVNAVFDETKAIKYKDYAASHTIEDCTLFVGSYLIHLNALNDTNYQKALDSMTEPSQFQIYYKSELANGVWYDITNEADGLHSIYDTGVIVEDADINDLYITFTIDSKGVTRNALTGAVVSIFDDPDPYDLKALPELQELKLLYEGQLSADDEGMQLYYYNCLRTFFDLNVHTEETNRLDQQLSNLQEAYNQLTEDGEDEAASAVMKLMEKVDNRRRALVYEKLSVSDEDAELVKLFLLLTSRDAYDKWSAENGHYSPSDLLKYLQEKALESKEERMGDPVIDPDVPNAKEDEREDPHEDPSISDLLANSGFEGVPDKADFLPIESFVSAASTARSECMSTYNIKSGDSLTDSDMVIAHVEYELSQAVIDASLGGAAAVLEPAKTLGILYNVSENSVINKEEELALVEEKLLPLAASNFEGAVNGGVSNKYLTVTGQGGSEVSKEATLEEQFSKAEAIRGELEFCIYAKKMRVSSANALSYTFERVDWTEAKKGGVKSDAFSSDAIYCINNHISWLNKLADQIVNEDESLQSELDRLRGQKEDLQKKRDEALDNNDRNLAKKYDTMIDTVDNAIAKEEASVNSLLEDENASAGDKAAAASGAGGTETGAKSDLLNSAKDAIAGGGDASKQIDALAALGAKDALDELAELGDDKLKDAIDDAKDNFGLSDGDGNGNGKGGLLSENELIGLIENLLGDSFENLDADGKVVAAVACEWYGGKENLKAKELSAKWIDICYLEKNPYVFNKVVTSDKKEFASLRAISKVTDFRYVYSQTGREATMTGKAGIYSFTNGSSQVVLPSKSISDMNTLPQYKGGELYIVEAAAMEFFECEVEPIEQSTHSALMKGDMETRARDLLVAMREND